MKGSIIVLFIVLGSGETDSTAVPGNTSMTLMSECELPRPALEVRLRTEEDALLLADCYLHCLDMASRFTCSYARKISNAELRHDFEHAVQMFHSCMNFRLAGCT